MKAGLIALLPRIAPIIARLSSEHDGERVACVAALERLLLSAGCDYCDLADLIAATGPTTASPTVATFHRATRVAVPKDVSRRLRDLLDSAFATDREVEIAASLLEYADRHSGLTERQLDLALDIIDKVATRAAEVTA
jgi:hypothetical protein